MQKIVRSKRLPSYSTVTRWLQDDESFRKKYAIARQEQAELLAGEIIAIADDGSNDTYTNEDGVECTNYDVIQRSRLRVDARKWIASKLLPKVYGEKQGDINNSVVVNNLTITADQLRSLQSRKAELDAARMKELPQ